MSKRTGATLVEVLVAIFVMGIGLLALLALFPLGVLSMAQAIQDDRAAHAAANATSLAVAQNMHNNGQLVDRVVNNVLIPGPFTNPLPGDPNVISAGANEPSWPVLVDGVGRTTAPGQFFNWVGGQKYGIARRTVSYAPTNNKAAVLQWFTLLDDIRFGTSGTPDPIAAGTFDREGNFSWAYLLRRPRNGNAAAVTMDVVIYSRRSLNLTPALIMPEYAFTGAVDLANGRPNIVTLTWSPGSNPPAVRAGGWILDATPNPDLQNPGKFKPGHAQFYRVVGVNEVATSAYALELELQDNPQGFSIGANGANPLGTFIVLEGVVEVIPRGTQWRP